MGSLSRSIDRCAPTSSSWLQSKCANPRVTFCTSISKPLEPSGGINYYGRRPESTSPLTATSVFDLWCTYVHTILNALTFRTRAKETKERERDVVNRLPFHFRDTMTLRDLLLVFRVNKRCHTRVGNVRGPCVCMYNIPPQNIITYTHISTYTRITSAKNTNALRRYENLRCNFSPRPRPRNRPCIGPIILPPIRSDCAI